jgi:hypothetical protein
VPDDYLTSIYLAVFPLFFGSVRSNVPFSYFAWAWFHPRGYPDSNFGRLLPDGIRGASALAFTNYERGSTAQRVDPYKTRNCDAAIR